MEMTKSTQTVAPGAAGPRNGAVHYYEVWKITGRRANGCGELVQYVLTLGGSVFPDLTQINLFSWARIDTVERLGLAHTLDGIDAPRRDPL